MTAHRIGPLLAGSRVLTGTETTALHSTETWWYTLLAPWIAERVRGDGGGITVSHRVYRATIDNALVEDITEIVTGGEVNLNHDRPITTEVTVEVRDASRINPYTDYLAVFQERTYADGRAAQSDQLGLYTVRVPPGTRTIERAEGIYTGHDLTAVLGRYAFTDAYNIAAGTNYGTAVTTILALAGISRHAIAATTTTLASAISFAVGTTYLEACNTLLEAIGYYHLSMTGDGKLTSGPTRDIRYVEPYRTITDDDQMEPITTQPTDTTVANVVIVVQDNFNAEPLTAVRRNDAADSPTSTTNLGTIVRVETRSDLADQDAVDALADRLLAEGRTWYQVARLRLLPDPGVLTPHQTVDLDLTGEAAIFNGKWWIRTARIGFRAASAAPWVEVNRITDTVNGRLI